MLDGVLRAQRQLDIFEVGRMQRERRRRIPGHRKLGDALTQRHQHAGRVGLALDSAGAVDICEHLRLDSDLEPVAQHNVAKTRPSATFITAISANMGA
jgi:hypothetical protein